MPWWMIHDSESSFLLCWTVVYKINLLQVLELTTDWYPGVRVGVVNVVDGVEDAAAYVGRRWRLGADGDGGVLGPGDLS